jgi:hypothetical protein
LCFKRLNIPYLAVFRGFASSYNGEYIANKMAGEMKSIGDILRGQIEEYQRLRNNESAILAFYASQAALPPKKRPGSVSFGPKAQIILNGCLTANMTPRIIEEEKPL